MPSLTSPKRSTEKTKSIAANIRLYRMKAGLSQEELGSHLNVTFQQIQKYEKGTNRISADKIEILCNLFGVSANALLGIDGQQNQSSTISSIISDKETTSALIILSQIKDDNKKAKALKLLKLFLEDE